MKSQEIINTAQKSKNESELIRSIAGDIKSSMDYIIHLASEKPTPPSPDPDPEPVPPTPPNNDLTGVVDIRSLGVKPIDELVKGLKYVDTYFNQIQINDDVTDSYYLLFAEKEGTVTYENILTNSNPTTLTFAKKGVHILKNVNGIFSVEAVENYVSDEFLNKYDFSNCTVYFPTGTYIHFQGHGINTFFFAAKNQPKKIIGGKNSTLLGITNNLDRQIPRIDCKLENLNLYNIIPSTGTRNRNRDFYFNNVELNFGVVTLPSTYVILSEGEKSNFFSNRLRINATDIYAGIWIERANNLIISETKINVKHSSHPIRINSYEGNGIVYKCEVNNSTTGIQVASQRRQLVRNLRIVDNIVDNCTEESISIDSFGNNTQLSPVIIKSFVDKVEPWDNLGVKVLLKDLYTVEGNPSDGYKHKIVDASFAPDPKNYLFMIEGGRLEYQFCEIVKSEVVNGKIMLYLNQFYNPADLQDVEIGLHTGAINCVIEGNTVKNARPETSQPGHAISLWGATYDCSILNNNIDNCKQGIHVAGYGSFGVTNPDFFNYSIRNSVEGNTISNCDESVAFRSFYGERKGFFNRFVNNTVKGGAIEIKDQIGFINENNNIS